MITRLQITDNKKPHQKFYILGKLSGGPSFSMITVLLIAFFGTWKHDV